MNSLSRSNSNMGNEAPPAYEFPPAYALYDPLEVVPDYAVNDPLAPTDFSIIDMAEISSFFRSVLDRISELFARFANWISELFSSQSEAAAPAITSETIKTSSHYEIVSFDATNETADLNSAQTASTDEIRSTSFDDFWGTSTAPNELFYT